jgi:hypothetical protein
MKTRKIIKIANKFVWDVIWYGFFVLLVVVVVSKPPIFFQTYYYSEGYLNPHLIAYNEIEAPLDAIELTKDSEIIQFYNKIVPRIEFLKYLMLLYFLIMFLFHYRQKIYDDVLDEQQKIYYLQHIKKFERFLK